VSAPAGQRGVNLIELIIAIVIISIASVGVLLVYAQVVQYSADPMVQQQAVALAEAYLDEILARPVDDPSGGESGTSEEGNPSLAASRPLLDDVKDYGGLTNGPPQDQNGIVLGDLANYTVSVAIFPDQDVNGVPMARVDVTVVYPPVVNFTLTGYRAN
jgi:MSHA pilin protein MshD